SFRPQGDRALDAGLGQPSATGAEALMAGLEVRRPALSRSGFFIDAKGTVLTTTEVTGNCRRLTIDDLYEADLTLSDAALGIAVLSPRAALAPSGHARFQTGFPRLKSEVALAGYSYEDLLDAPVVSFGTLADLKGLNGEPSLARLDLRSLAGDAGGPVVDASGAVVGMLLPRETDGDRVLPEDVGFALQASPIATALTEKGLAAEPNDSAGALAPEDLSAIARAMTVRVSCWN